MPDLPPESFAVLGEFGVYIRLVWLFVFIITVLMLSLCYVFLSRRRALEQEAASMEFSDLVIEGLEKERLRVSRELHDAVLPLVHDSEVSGLIRSICTELMPPDFNRLSLKDSLAGLCMQFSERTGIECVYLIEDELAFSPFSAEDQLHLYRIVQESLTNIEKHSGSGKAALTVRRCVRLTTDTVLVCISDEGKGLSATEPRQRGLGMRGMRQRAAIIGAKLDFISEPGNGLMVRIELSLPCR